MNGPMALLIAFATVAGGAATTMDQRFFEYLDDQQYEKLRRLLHSAPPRLVDAVRPESNGFTPLHGAANMGDYELARILLAHRASLTALTDMGMTPLMLAASRGDIPDIVVLLLDHMGSSDRALVLDRQEPHLGWSALFMAAFSGDEQSVKALLSSGANATLTGLNSFSGLSAADAARAGGHAAISATISEAQRRHAAYGQVSRVIDGASLGLVSTLILALLVGASLCLRGAYQEQLRGSWCKEEQSQRQGRRRQRELQHQQAQETQLGGTEPKLQQKCKLKGSKSREPLTPGSGDPGGPRSGGTRGRGAAARVRPTATRTQENQEGPREPFCAEPAMTRVTPTFGAVDDDTVDGECAICMDGARTHAFVPCGHRMVCEPCATRVLLSADPACPSCRSACTQALRVYL